MHRNSLLFLKFKNAPSDVNDKIAEEVHKGSVKILVNVEAEKKAAELAAAAQRAAAEKAAAQKAAEIAAQEKAAQEKAAIERAAADKNVGPDMKNKERQISWDNLKSDLSNLDMVINLIDVDESVYPYLRSFTNLKSMTFSNKFNSSINLSELNSLETIVFGVYFNQPVSKANLPPNLQKLVFGLNFIRKIDSLPDNLQELVFNNRFNSPVNLPSNLKSVVFGDGFNQDLVLPDSLESVVFGYHFNKEINIPANLKNLEFGNKFNKELSLNNKLENLVLGTQFNCGLVLPNSMKTLTARNKDILSRIALNRGVKVL
jgi:hypothetical protein